MNVNYVIESRYTDNVCLSHWDVVRKFYLIFRRFRKLNGATSLAQRYMINAIERS